MNKIFAFLCANTMIFTIQGEESIDNNTTARNLDFGSWYNFTQEDENEIERRVNQTDEEIEENEGSDHE